VHLFCFVIFKRQAKQPSGLNEDSLADAHTLNDFVDAFISLERQKFTAFLQMLPQHSFPLLQKKHTGQTTKRRLKIFSGMYLRMQENKSLYRHILVLNQKI
jgi:hypothetical protein